MKPEKDSLQRFIFENSDVRGLMVHLDESFQTIMQQHHYPKVVHEVLAETLAAAVLLSSTLKYEGQLTVQFQSAGPVKMLVAKCNEKLEIRGLAQFDELVIAEQSQEKLLENGELLVTILPDNQTEPYQSVVPLTKKTIAENLEDYFGISVQIPTKIWLETNDNKAVGMLLQLLPTEKQSIQEREQFWEHATKLGETLKAEELLECDNKTLLHRLYHGEDIRLYDEEPVQFNCGCSQERMAQVIKVLDRAEIDDIFSESQVLDISCEYCNQVYSFDKIDVAAMFHETNS